ncbi:GrpB family protein [Halorubrum sp. FL23]|uniref:GrpB family protein n=1 Tax=Halorubrum sp. FL23 TaxID=3458704 RepID=UPI004033246F
MLGLARGTVALVPHQESWSEAYDAEVARLTDAVGDRVERFEHVGSTAVEGMPAKPILDVLALVDESTPASDLVPPLETRGYERRPDEVDGRVFLAKGPPENRTCYLSIAEVGSAFHDETTAFRDALRTDPELAERYASLKRRLAARYPESRDRYTAEKGAFVRDVLDRRE